MNFFEGMETRIYFSSLYNNMKAEVERLNDAEIFSADFKQLAESLADKYYLAPISIFTSDIDRTLSEVKVKKPNPFRGSPYQRDFSEIDGVRITFKIPFDGNPDLFVLKPSTFILSRFTTENLIKPSDKEYGSFALAFEYTKQELQEKGETMNEFVKKQFDQEFKDYKTMIDYVNAEVSSYNKGLNSTAMKLLTDRKDKADSFSAISDALQIPLTTSKNAPNTKPIPIQRVVRQPATKPTVPPSTPEYCISDSDYENINNIISMCGTTMEKTARTYYRNDEEELRDHLLAALNTHYENATGETFRKIGKTDIHIEFENKAAFIGECKIWSGESKFQEAIQQVINYSTWRDLKVSVIIFNKNNKSFHDILPKIEKWVEENTITHNNPQANIWKCKFHRQDTNVDIQLTILAFDLYVDKTQFKDSRHEN